MGCLIHGPTIYLYKNLSKGVFEIETIGLFCFFLMLIAQIHSNLQRIFFLAKRKRITQKSTSKKQKSSKHTHVCSL